MCLTCRIIAGEKRPPGGVIFETANVILHHCIDVAVPGYLVASPKRHINTVTMLADEEYLELVQLLRVAVQLLEEIPGVEKIYIASIGEETTHIHFHLFPRYGWMLDNLPQTGWTDGKLDGLKLMAYVRQHYKAGEAEMNSIAIMDAVEIIRQKLSSA